VTSKHEYSGPEAAVASAAHAQPPSATALSVRGIRHSFGAVQALREVDFEVRPGEVMALLGENGAGKSTLVNILAGLIDPDDGEIRIGDERIRLGTPRRSRAAGIAITAQEPSVIGTLTVAENIFLGGVPFSGPWSLSRLAKAARTHLRSVGLEQLDPRTTVATLTVAERHLVELARLLARDARILILDEPTAALSDNEIDLVKRSVRHLAEQGLSIIYVTHRLGEVFEIADRVTVMRNGRSLPARPVAEMTMQSLIVDIVGRPLADMYPARATRLGDVVLRVDEIRAASLAAPVSLAVQAGEILGVAGQTGSGNGVLLRCMAGLLACEQGAVAIRGHELPRGYTLAKAIRFGLAYCSADRKLDGVFAELPVSDNLSAPALRRVSRGPWRSRSREARLAAEIAARFALSPARLRHDAGTLSGGNQQKVALGKWLSIDPKVILVEEPTRGVDVGARAEIYQHLRSMAEDGLAVVFASSDLDEVYGLSDTIATMYRGRWVRSAPAASWTRGDILLDITQSGGVDRATS
jgi:ribose transport system ATP-binding protein